MADKQLEALVDKIADTRKAAEVNLSGKERLPTFPGLKIAKGQAQKALVALRNQFDKIIFDRVSVVLAQGPADKAQEFADLAATEGDALVLDGNALYSDVAKKVKLSLTSNGCFSTTQYMHMCAAIKEIAEKLGIERIDFPKHVAQVTVKTEAALAEHIKRLMYREYSNSLNAKFLENQAMQKAFEGRYTQSIVPVVVTNVTGEEAASLSKLLFTGKNVVADLSQEKPTKAFVIKNFVALKNLRKGSTKAVEAKEVKQEPINEVTNQTQTNQENNEEVNNG